MKTRLNQKEFQNITYIEDKSKKFIDVDAPINEKGINIENMNKREYQISKYSNNISLCEAVLINNIPCFLQVINGEIKLKEKIELDDFLLVPPDRTTYLSKAYFFSSVDEISRYHNRARKENFGTLYEKVKNIWKKYLDIDENSLVLCAADTIFTYFQDKLGITHYLLFVGDNNSGKSNALRILDNLGYRPMFDTSVTPANIYNFLDKIEEGQGIILEDEIDSIEDHDEKMRIYKGGYVSGTKVTRIYDLSTGNKSSRRQQRYYTYCFKAFSSEKYPAFYKAKGFNERLLTVNCTPGNPQYDITEVVNNAGDTSYKKLYNELLDLRKLLLLFRIQNYNNPISDVQLSIRNRDKQLCKPLIRLFQSSKCVKEVTRSLSHFISEKKNKKLNSLDSYLYSIIVALTKNGKMTISNELIWNMILQLPGDTIPYKPHSYQTDEFGTVSKYQVTRICEDKFGARRSHDGEKRNLLFNPHNLAKLESNYSKLKEIKIVSNLQTNTTNTFNTFWNTVENKNNLNMKKQRTKTDEVSMINEDGGKSYLEISNSNLAISDENNSQDTNKVLDVLSVLDNDTSDDKIGSESDYLIYLNNSKRELGAGDKLIPHNIENNPEIGYKEPFYYCKKHPKIENIQYKEIVDHIQRSSLHTRIND